MLCQDVLQIIMEFLQHKSQLKMHSTCKEFNTLKITVAKSSKLTGEILRQDKYKYIKT